METKLIKTASGMEVEQDGKSYPVRSEDEWIEFAPFGFDVFEVKIPSERVRIVETEQQIKYTNGEYSRSSQMIKYATLLTEDKEGEGQGDLWDELFDHIENTPVDVPWADCIKELKQKFKITKK